MYHHEVGLDTVLRPIARGDHTALLIRHPQDLVTGLFLNDMFNVKEKMIVTCYLS